MSDEACTLNYNDRHILLAQIANLLFVLRASNQYESPSNRRSIFPFDHLIQQLTELQSQIHAVTSSSYESLLAMNGGKMSERHHNNDANNTSKNDPRDSQSFGLQRWSRSGNGLLPRPRLTSSSTPRLECPLTEKHIVSVFRKICCSSGASETFCNAALAALTIFVESRCQFVTAAGLTSIMETAFQSRCEVTDTAAHELFLVRLANLFAACLTHPKAVEMPEEQYVSILGWLFMVYSCEDNMLVRETLTKTFSAAVGVFFKNVAAGLSNDAEAGTQDGTRMLSFMSLLISGSVSSFSEDGKPNLKKDAKAASSPIRTKISSGLTANGMLDELLTIELQLAGLHMAQRALCTLREYSAVLTDTAPVLKAVENDLCRALLIAGVGTTNNLLMAHILRVVHLVVECMPHSLVPQIYSFLSVLHLAPLQAIDNDRAMNFIGVSSNKRAITSPSPPPVSSPSTRIPFTSIAEVSERRVLLLESLGAFFTDANFCIFCFTHYDLSWRYPSILPTVLYYLEHTVTEDEDEAEKAASAAAPSTTATGRAPSEKSTSPSLADNSQQSPLPIFLATTAITNLLISLNRRDESLATISVAPAVRQNFDATLLHVVKQKKVLQNFQALFNESPLRKGISYLLQQAVTVPANVDYHAAVAEHKTWLIIHEPADGRAIGHLLHRLAAWVDKRVLGNYIGELGKEEEESHDAVAKEAAQKRLGSATFFNEQLIGYMEEFNFKGKSLITSIREMVYNVCLPGESQKIDRVMEAFAKEWYRQNKHIENDTMLNPFHSESGAFILSFAIIMLNTDQHSRSVEKKMVFNEFKNMNRGIDNDQDLPEDYLLSVFQDVVEHEVIMSEMMDRGYTNDTAWGLDMQKTSANGFDNVLALCNLTDAALGQGTRPDELRMLALPHVFSLVADPSLRVFKVALWRSAIAISASPAQGTTMEESLDVAYRAAPYDVLLFRSTLKGITAMTQASIEVSSVAVADSCMKLLLSIVSFAETSLSRTMEAIARSPPVLFVLRELLYLLPLASTAGAEQCWSGVAQVLKHLQQLGLFSLRLTPNSNVRIPVNTQRFLLEEPALRLDILEAACFSSKSGSNTGNGWFSSLFGGSANLSEEAKRKKNIEQFTQRVQSFPDILTLLSILRCVDGTARKRLMEILCETSTVEGTSVQALLNMSYVAALLGGWMRLALEDTGRSTDPNLYDCISRTLLPFFETTLSFVFEVNERSVLPAGSRRSASVVADPSSCLTAEEHTLWSQGVYNVVQSALALASAMATRESLAPNVLRLFQILLRAPRKTFTFTVARPLSTFVYMWALYLQETAGGSPQQQEQESQLSASGRIVSQHNLLSAVTMATTATASFGADDSVIEQLSATLYIIAFHQFYDVMEGTKYLVDAALALAPLYRSSNNSNGAQHHKDQAMGQPPMAPPPPVRESKSPVDALGSCCQNISRAMETLCAPGSTPTSDAWFQLWLLSLSGLSVMVLCASTTKDGMDALLALQRSLLSPDTEHMPSASLTALYDKVLFPLVEKTCAPQAETTTSGGARPSLPARVSVDIKCRVLSLLPKAALRAVTSGPASDATMLALWRRLIGTLYAVYTSYPAEGGSGDTTLEEEECIQMREVVNESVKNIVIVLTTVDHAVPNSGARGETTTAAPQAELRTHIASWLKPFDFSTEILPLLQETVGTTVTHGGDATAVVVDVQQKLQAPANEGGDDESGEVAADV